jgi:hypothetical protein
MARKSKYDTHVKPYLDEIQGWAMSGLTDEQIADNLGLSARTLYEYKNKYPQFLQALKKGKDIADAQVVNSLFRLATGFTYHEEATTTTGEVVTVQKYSKPNTTATIFWLKNRQPDKWRDKTEVKADIAQTVVFTGEDDLED